MEPIPTRGGARVARGLVGASVCALLSYCGHMAAGGASPDLGLLLVLALLLAGFLITLADHRRGPLAVLALVGGSQLALHGLLQLLGAAHAGHTVQQPVLMLGAHALATLATSAVLAGAEDAVFTVAAALARALPLAVTVPPVPEQPGRATAVTGPLDSRLRGALGHRLYPRRGPPREHATAR
ncbi:MAG TPA: hypothetical protein VNP03_00450 [Pseudonocardia sp.]|nr:hypothetical protein [Pseudonocardia sp.]